ncbi:unnamed protein product [Pipistrellus nathusii]|uniref:Uncharacterized protein n=1 Tax=Pipistrellus nathusii TaxID=59473 RepID=A0ABP0ABL4_PIPNA
MLFSFTDKGSRLREMKSAAQDHIARIQQSQNSDSFLILIPVPFPAYHVASKVASLFTGKLFLSTPHPPTPSFLKRYVCVFIRITFTVFGIHVLICVWGGGGEFFHQLVLRSTWKKKKSINAVADVQLKKCEVCSFNFL